jgi:hypothetical protein
MSATISTSIAAQASATTTLLITGTGTTFTLRPSPIGCSSGTIVSQQVISDSVVSISFAAPAQGDQMPSGSVLFTDLSGSGGTCLVMVRALPILERIRQNLVAAIGQINQAAGFFTNPSVQEIASANSDVDQMILVGLGESRLIKPPLQHVYWKQTFWVLCYSLPPEGQVGSAAAVDPGLLYLFSDVFKAVYVDRTRGQLAYDTVIQPPQFEAITSEAQFRVAIPIHVLYRTLENDPTSLG